MRFVAVAVAAALLGILSHVAAAQPGMTPSTPVEMVPAPVPAPPLGADELDPRVATTLSVGGTVLSLGLFTYGVASQSDAGAQIATIGAIGSFFAPSFGQWYSHKFFTRGMGLRTLGLTAGFVGAALAFSACPIFSDGDECHDSTAAPVLAVVGLLLYASGTVDDMMTAGDAARKYNAQQRAFAVAPTMMRNGGGVAVVGTF